MSKEHNFKQDVMTLYCKNLGTVNISENLFQTSRNKCFIIHHHSIGEFTEENIVTYEHVITQKQSRDIPSAGLNTS